MSTRRLHYTPRSYPPPDPYRQQSRNKFTIRSMFHSVAHVSIHTPSSLTNQQRSSGRLSNSLVARVLSSVTGLTDEVGSFSRSSEEVFLLVRDLAMGHEAVRRHLLASEMAARLALFVMRDLAPSEVRASRLFTALLCVALLHRPRLWGTVPSVRPYVCMYQVCYVCVFFFST